MSELGHLVTQAQGGDRQAYESIVRRFQDMAVGYSYALLGDADLAEDAAQEAFIHAFYNLSSLREPAAFAGWFRRIVFTQVHRLTRRRKVTTVSLDRVPELAATDRGHAGAADPAEVVEEREARDEVYAAIAALPEAQRQAIALYYMGSYSQQEIGAFLDVPVSTVKMRLYHARRQLKERMIAMIEDDLQKRRPSRDDTFTETVMTLNDRVIEMDGALRQLAGDGVDLETVLAPHPWSIRADPAQVDQVLTSLAAGACEMMPGGGQLTIETTNVTLDDGIPEPYAEMPPGEYILLTVRDTGYGICAKGPAPCCAAGQDLSGAVTALPTIADFVRQSKGYIWVSCKRGGGTTFEICLPRKHL